MNEMSETTCKDCIHFDVCQDIRYGDISDCPSDRCGGFFESKADVQKWIPVTETM